MANFIDGLFSDGSLPALERSLRFTEARHQRLLENVANAETPGYRRKDLSTARFDEALKEAMRPAGTGKPRPRSFNPDEFLETDGSRSILRILDRDGMGQEVNGMLRHDGNNVDIDREMAALVRNASRFNQAINLLKKSYGEIGMAIAERPTV